MRELADEVRAWAAWVQDSGLQNLAILRERGARSVGPAVGEMAERSHVGPGRLAEPKEIVEAAEMLLKPRDLDGIPVLVTAGPTREMLDPVRFLSNPSSGRMGYAVAEAARDRGAQVTLISGPVSLPGVPGVHLVHIGVAGLPPHGPAQVLLAVVEDGLTSKVLHGENEGRTLPHTAVVRALKGVGSIAKSAVAWDGEIEVPTDPSWKRTRLIVFVQDRESMRVLAAGPQ